eukprot:225618_1
MFSVRRAAEFYTEREYIVDDWVGRERQPTLFDGDYNDIHQDLQDTVLNRRAGETGEARMEGYVSRSRSFLQLFSIATCICQIIIVLVVLTFFWDDSGVCDKRNQIRWKVWSMVYGLRLSLYAGVSISMYNLSLRGRAIPQSLTRAKGILEMASCMWFTLGNVWIARWLVLGADDASCTQPWSSPIYVLCFALLIVTYIQITLPCIIAIFMVPILCICLPCWVRLVVLLPKISKKGASDEAIDCLPMIRWGEIVVNETGHERKLTKDSLCSICLVDYTKGNLLRLLPCGHMFHESCSRSWLGISKTCPICRMPIDEKDPSCTQANNIHGAAEGVDVSPRMSMLYSLLCNTGVSIGNDGFSPA